jgi:uncharacterized membrane protein
VAISVLEQARGSVVRSGRAALAQGWRPQLPIQRSLDVAVPVDVAWREWMQLDLLPEGVHRICAITRRDDEMRGRLNREQGARWRAVVTDERPQESFAWQSRRGADCAGLITFHVLGRRLTRLELTLDVVPLDAGQALSLATRAADRRAHRDLRRFKTRVEVINPDLYDD